MHNSRKSKSLVYIKRLNKTIRSSNKLFLIKNPEFKAVMQLFGFTRLCRKYYATITQERKDIQLL